MDTALAAGDTLGRYELLAAAASGGMAKVWAARLRGTHGFQKTVAVKTMLASLRDDASFERMFLDEASLASRIHHPHVAQILDLGEERGVLYLVMEWVDGESLADLLAAGPVPVPIAVRIAMQACAGLHAAHELKDDAGQLVGLVHRDVSPQNILVTMSGVTKVVDFGIAAVARDDPTNVELRGKAAYAAPEQVFDGEVDRRTDVFALGIVLYEMLVGAHPFEGENELATMAAISSPDPPPSPRARNAGIPEALERVVMRALAKEPADRYATANDMLRDLDLSLPARDRASTDEDVATFVRSVRGAEHDKRSAALAETLRALEAAEGKSQPLAPTGAPPTRLLTRWNVAVAAGMVGVIAVAASWLGGSHEAAQSAPTSSMTPPTRATVAAPSLPTASAVASAVPAPPASSALTQGAATVAPSATPSVTPSATPVHSVVRPHAPVASASTFRSPVTNPGF